ncbi:MAG: DUF1822 family protein [Synechococcales cyanobacterium M58_A2018_015]|nr:DUF1822 family protein [Synechococcales cyanobacterium M58_A2018_015]
MMDTADQSIPITLPITATDRRQAYQAAKHQPSQTRAEQIYRNTLAVLVTQHYLQLLGIDSDLEMSQSWNPLSRLLDDLADLYVPVLQGYLECRPVHRGDQKSTIPEDARHNRIGYVFIQLDEPYQEGQILGFVESVSVSELPLSYLRPLHELIERFLDQSPPSSTQLNQWFNRMFEPDWQASEELLDSMKDMVLSCRGISLQRGEVDSNWIQQRIQQLYRQQSPDHMLPIHVDSNPEEALVHLIQTTPDDEIRWQSAELLWDLNPQHPSSPVIRAKDLGFYLAGHRVALMVGMLPKSDGRMLLLLRLYPLEQPFLPAGLKLIGLDEAGHPFFQVESRSQDDYMQFKFTADRGDYFSVCVMLQDVSFTESFVV